MKTLVALYAKNSANFIVSLIHSLQKQGFSSILVVCVDCTDETVDMAVSSGVGVLEIQDFESETKKIVAKLILDYAADSKFDLLLCAKAEKDLNSNDLCRIEYLLANNSLDFIYSKEEPKEGFSVKALSSVLNILKHGKRDNIFPIGLNRQMIRFLLPYKLHSLNPQNEMLQRAKNMGFNTLAVFRTKNDFQKTSQDSLLSDIFAFLQIVIFAYPSMLFYFVNLIFFNYTNTENINDPDFC